MKTRILFVVAVIGLMFNTINTFAYERNNENLDLNPTELVGKSKVIAIVKLLKSFETTKTFRSRYEIPYRIHEFEVIKPFQGIKEQVRFVVAQPLVKTTTLKPLQLLQLKEGEEFLVFLNNQNSFSYTETSGKEVTKKRLMIIDTRLVFSANPNDEPRELKRINELFNISLPSVKEFIEKISSVTKRKHEK